MFKKICLSILLLLFFFSFAEAKECEDCTQEKPCLYSFPAGDGCNTCNSTTWCENNKWYTGGVSSCTVMYCGGNHIEIMKPKFETDKPN